MAVWSFREWLGFVVSRLSKDYGTRIVKREPPPVEAKELHREESPAEQPFKESDLAHLEVILPDAEITQRGQKSEVKAK